MNRLLLATTFLFAVAGGAFAADAVVYEAPPETIVGYSWTGAYVGVQGGYAWADTDVSVPLVPFADTFDVDGGFVGALAGFNYQMGSFVGGIEADVNKAWIDETLNVDGFGVDAELDWFASIRGRAGFAFDRTMIFGTAGVAFAGADINSIFGGENIDFTGWTAGGGVEHAVTDNITIRGEYRYYDFGSEDITSQPLPASADLTMHTVSFGAAYKF
jgi:outer membrane immunogenic protein